MKDYICLSYERASFQTESDSIANPFEHNNKFPGRNFRCKNLDNQGGLGVTRESISEFKFFPELFIFIWATKVRESFHMFSPFTERDFKFWMNRSKSEQPVLWCNTNDKTTTKKSFPRKYEIDVFSRCSLSHFPSSSPSRPAPTASCVYVMEWDEN